MLARIAPEFRHEDVVDWTCSGRPLVEPVHALGELPRVAPFLPDVPGLGSRLGEPDLPATAQRRLLDPPCRGCHPRLADRLGLLV